MTAIAKTVSTAVLASAFAAALGSFASVSTASAAEMMKSPDNTKTQMATGKFEECYGVALAGQNDCAAGAHSCAGIVDGRLRSGIVQAGTEGHLHHDDDPERRPRHARGDVSGSRRSAVNGRAAAGRPPAISRTIEGGEAWPHRKRAAGASGRCRRGPASA